MRLERLHAHALAHAGTTVTRQWGDDLVFKVAGKMFLVLSLDGQTVSDLSFKVTPADSRAGATPIVRRPTWPAPRGCS